MLDRKGIGLSIILAIALIMAGCSGSSAGSGGGELLKVGTDAAYPPFETQGGDGEITGFDIDIIKAIAKAEGMKVSVKHTGWDPLFEAVKRGKVDAGISAMTITEKRKETFDFSEPYFEAKQLILLPADSDVKSLKDLKGKEIGVQSGTTGEVVVQEAFGKTYKGIRGYDDTPAAIDDLASGRVDAVVADNGVVQDYMKQKLPEGKFKTVEDASFEKEYYGIIVKKGNKDLLEKINSGLKKIQEDGTYDKIYQKYFGEK
ncbi:amino acid ABC transporter substrate-binding protein (PAAT family) [Melghirimyces profundicolus]|uniref:Amino acid ABC transporter substrate-binding protein (PAAT family) n=1 Tax=Melghirimyces profundicolus TaxID=1242148 RepID=A0A2T6C2M9_9BACL|nr:basic amino acid ABC transporter substrate-binding protein [Melghirimyces profundicolus]PTX62569.1 amino acid ABC transporter substrate-binding protein (PAAT family) [Melghirimyces profundicolus]